MNHQNDNDNVILVDDQRPLVIITLNRPHKLNALTKPMWEKLGKVMTELAKDRSIRCIIIRGAGEKSFSPGNDISEFKNVRSNSLQAKEYGQTMRAVFDAFHACPIPIVAMIHGICVGGGLEIASLCDIRVCGKSSRFGAPIRQLGLTMGHMELSHLLQLVGQATALELLLEGRIYDAADAKQKGIVNHIVDDSLVTEEAMKIAQNIAQSSPLVARWHKQFIKQLLENPLATIPETILDEAYRCYDTDDFKIGVESFLAKQKPQFTGK
jgi:enoyl-CoA hydratase